MSDRIITIIEDTSKDLFCRILSPETGALVGGDRDMPHRGNGLYSSAKLSGLLGTKASPKEYAVALYEKRGNDEHLYSSDLFLWDGTEIVKPSSADSAASNSSGSNSGNSGSSGSGSSSNYIPLTQPGAVIYQTLPYKGFGAAIAPSQDKIRTNSQGEKIN